MYATCTFCHRTLGSNESIDAFPVGRRLAFDVLKGRLWVVCTYCQRWNLTPLEERWEAIEMAAQLFSASKLRHSTDNIGLARVGDGTELIRIGKPLRPEMASWRYGRIFVRRWTGMAIGAGAGAAAVAASALVVPTAALLALASGAISIGAVGGSLLRMGGKVAFVGRFILDNEQQYVLVSPKMLPDVRLITHENQWALRVPYLSRRPTIEQRWRDVFDLGGMGHVTISGQPAVTAARQLLPLINSFGARQSVVESAVTLAGTWSSISEAFVYSLARTRELHAKQLYGDLGSLNYLPPVMRLALEMSLHEEQEQRALDGEMSELERTWREAEIVAGIADELLTPASVLQKVDWMKGRN